MSFSVRNADFSTKFPIRYLFTVWLQSTRHKICSKDNVIFPGRRGHVITRYIIVRIAVESYRRWTKRRHNNYLSIVNYPCGTVTKNASTTSLESRRHHWNLHFFNWYSFIFNKKSRMAHNDSYFQITFNTFISVIRSCICGLIHEGL